MKAQRQFMKKLKRNNRDRNTAHHSRHQSDHLRGCGYSYLGMTLIRLIVAAAFTLLATGAAWSVSNVDNGMANPAECHDLNRELHSDRIHYIAAWGLLKEAHDRGDVEEVWRLKRKLYSASVRKDIQTDKFYRGCPESPIR